MVTKELLIQPYQTTWPIQFEAIRKVILVVLPGISIEHVGSTAVPSLAAKPIIDIDVICHPGIGFAAIEKALASIGYTHCGDQGIKGREVFKRSDAGRKHPVLDRVNHHLYVCAEGNEELRRHLLFRDRLRANENDRREYQQLKYYIASLASEDRKKYAQLKESMAKAFIENILASAGLHSA